MRFALKSGLCFRLLMLGGLAGLGMIAHAGARNVAPQTKSARGGLLAKTEHHQFEVFFYPTGIRLFPMDSTGKSVDATGVSAIAIFYHANAPTSPWFDRPLRTEPAAAGKTPDSLMDAISLGTVPASTTKVVFEVSGLPDPVESSVSFTLPVEFLGAPAAAVAKATSENPRYVYASGFQGVGYYANPGPQTAPPAAATRAVAPPRFSGGQTVGPGVRDWSTGRRGQLHKPWLQSRG